MAQKIVGAFACVRNPSNPSKILMILRKNNLYANCLSLPGGAKKIHETLKNAAVREVREETNIRIRIGKEIGYIDFVGDHDSSRYYRAHVFESEYLSGELKPGFDVKDVLWLDENNILYQKVALPVVLLFYKK